EGGAGRLLHWDLDGEPDVISDAFPYLVKSGIAGESASGISAAVPYGDAYYAIVGEARNKGHQELYRLEPGSPPIGVTGQDVLGLGHPQPITNPYDLVVDANGDVLVTDSGRNSIVVIKSDGNVTDYALLGPIGTVDDPLDAVPTGLTVGPDGAYYVTTLTGWPHPPGAALVYRIDEGNGRLTIAYDGFSSATDLAFEADGSLLVTEFSIAMADLVTDLTAARAAELPGRLVRRTPSGVTEVVAEGLVGPTAVAIVGDRIFVSEEFGGRVREVGPARPARLTLTAALLAASVGLISAIATAVALRRWWIF
ncbi:MAG: ScyD/ScyE family protein, partial [Chloroflexi bacterium]|nr:ScyD/ScyE family protein [Chloroflexota bacterium]